MLSISLRICCLRGEASDLHKDVAEQGARSPHVTQTPGRDLKTLAALSCEEHEAP